MVNQSDQFFGFPIDLGNPLMQEGQGRSAEKGTGMVLHFDFTQGQTLLAQTVSYNINLENQMQRNLIRQVQSCYADNSTGTADVIIQFRNNSNQRIVIPAGWCGYFPLVISGDARFVISSGYGGSSDFVMILLNTAQRYAWPASGIRYNLSSATSSSGARPKLYPQWKATRGYVGQTAAAGNTSIISIAPGEGFFLTSILVGITGSAQLAAPGDLTINITSGTGGFGVFRAITSINAAFVGNVILINQTDLGFNSVQSDGDLVINLSAALTAGNVFWSVGGGPTPMFG